MIEKRRPPATLTTYRQAPDTSVEPPGDARYDGPGFEAVKPAIREALVAEQRGLCCYCNDRIEPRVGAMKIEHRVPQHVDPSRDLDWSNLLGACLGEITPARGAGARSLHCDSAKGAREITFDPTCAPHVAAVSYERSGRIRSSVPGHDRELDEVLRLNDDELLRRRRRSLEELQMELRRRHAGAFPKTTIQRLREVTLSPPGRLRPFAGYLASWLDRAMRKVS